MSPNKSLFIFLLSGITIGFLISLILRRATTFNHCVQLKSNYIDSQILNKSETTVKLNMHASNPIIFPMFIQTPQGSQETSGQKQLVLIGVMTATKYLHTRAVAAYRTWGHTFPGKIIFFAGGNATKITESEEENPLLEMPDIPLVVLPGVDDSYPPQKKSFMMLKYMFDHYGDQYEWFLRSDDDLYIRGEKLVEFLRSLNSLKLYFIGQAGRGTNAEQGTLNLTHNENFCMGGPGVIFSQATMKKVIPHVFECLKNMLSSHEDVEVGRCVHRFAKISCTWAYEMQSIFYHNSSGELAFTKELKQREVHRAITLHPIKDHTHLYRLHSYFQAKEIEKLYFEIVLLQRDLYFTSLALGSNSDNGHHDLDILTKFDAYNVTGLAPSLRKYIPENIFQIEEWRYIGKSGFHSPRNNNPKQKIDVASKEGLRDVIRELMDIINGFSKVRGRVIEFKELLYGYHRVNPLYGEDFVLDLLMTYKKYRGRKMTVPVRRHAYIQRSFGPLQLRLAVQESSSSSANSKSNNLVFIVPLAGRFSTFARFLQNFRFVCEQSNLTADLNKGILNINLVVVHFGTDLEKAKFLDLVQSYRRENDSSPSESCAIKVVQVDGEFSRGIALETGISQCSEDDILFLVDVDIVFSPEAVQRILLNTVQGVQVYFPIVFSEFSNGLIQKELHEAENFEISSQTGYWREFGFGIAAFYKSDFRSVGGFDVSIRGWGKEDVALFDKFIRTNLTIFRSPDPELIHMYHAIHCDPKLSHSQYEMCLGTQASTLGSYKNLINFIFNHRNENKRLNELSTLIFRS